MCNAFIVQPVGKLHKKGNKGFYSFILIFLWITFVIGFACVWDDSRASFVVENSSPAAIFNRLNVPTPPAKSIAPSLSMLISDAIIVSITLYELELNQQTDTYRYGAAICCGAPDTS